MQPIVNRLEQEYSDKLAFDSHDANIEPGRTLMQEYNLRGHPSYVVVDPQGKKLWSVSGLLDETVLLEVIEKFAVE